MPRIDMKSEKLRNSNHTPNLNKKFITTNYIGMLRLVKQARGQKQDLKGNIHQDHLGSQDKTK